MDVDCDSAGIIRATSNRFAIYTCGGSGGRRGDDSDDDCRC